MATSRAVWGIDLGQCALKAIQLRAAGEKVEAVDYVYIEHTKILSQPDADRASLVAETMAKFAQKHDLSRDILVVGVPGQHTLARYVKLPAIENKKKIPEIVKFEAQQQIPFGLDEVIWDYQVLRSDGPETEVGIFAMRRDLMAEQLKFLSDLNLEPAIVQSAPLALYNALQYDGLCGTEPVAVIDIGAQNTNFLAMDGDSLWTRFIPIGGNNFTEAMLEAFKLSFKKAEDLKRRAGSHKYARQIFQAMRPVFTDLVAEIQRSISFFTSSRRSTKLARLVAMGNAFKLPGTPKFIQQNLGLDVVRPDNFNRLVVSAAPNSSQLLEQLPSFGVAYGLALQGLGLARITTNLLPGDILKQVVWRKKSPWFYGAAACLVLSAGLIWVRNFTDSSVVTAAGQSSSEVDEAGASRLLEGGADANVPSRELASKVISAAQKLNGKLSEINGEIEKTDAEIRKIQDLQAEKVVWPRILNMILSILPPSDSDMIKAVAEGPDSYKKLVTTNPKYKRNARKQVFIDRLDTVFSRDVLNHAKAEADRLQGVTASAGPVGIPGGPGAPGAPSPEPHNGFVITLVGRTTFAGGNRQEGLAFVNREIVGRLRDQVYTESKAPAGGQAPSPDPTTAQAGIYFDAVRLVRCKMMHEMQSASGGGLPSAGMFPGRPGPDAEPGSGTREPTDPVTGEITSKDWYFEIVFAAVRGEKPAVTPPAGSDSSAPSASGDTGKAPTGQ